MKNLFLFGFMVAGMLTGKLLAQGHQMGSSEKMKVFANWVGHWKGEGTVQMGPGEPAKSSIDERIELKLDGMILVVEGVGKTKDPATQEERTTHHAFAVLSFDQTSGEYKFKTYLRDGRSADAWFKDLSDNNYQWGFDTPQGKIRYTIAINMQNKTWYEKGEFSRDGNEWRKFMDMTLTKVGP